MAVGVPDNDVVVAPVLADELLAREARVVPGHPLLERAAVLEDGVGVGPDGVALEGEAAGVVLFRWVAGGGGVEVSMFLVPK